MTELQPIFAEPLATTVFLYGSAVMLGLYAAVALFIRGPGWSAASQRPRPA